MQYQGCTIQLLHDFSQQRPYQAMVEFKGRHYWTSRALTPNAAIDAAFELIDAVRSQPCPQS
jgi:hypothetical protein